MRWGCCSLACSLVLAVSGCANRSDEVAAEATTSTVPSTTSTSTTTTSTTTTTTTIITTTTTTAPPPPTILLTHPNDLASYLNGAAVELLGRAAPSEAINSFVTYIHDLERTSQLAAARGEASYRVDPQAQAFEFIRTNYSAEVGAYAFLQQSNCLEKMMAGESC